MRRIRGGRLFAALTVTVALLVPLAVVGGPALARSTASSSAQYQYRVTICHLTGSKKHPAVTITVSSSAVAAHLRHGDHLGACTGSEKPKAHGNGDDGQGQNDNNGNGHGHGHGK